MASPPPQIVAQERELNSLYLVTTIVVLVVVTVTFASLILVFLWRSQNAYLWGRIYIPSLLWVTTGLLLASSVTLEQARAAMKFHHRTKVLRFVGSTTGLGCLFLLGQAASWLQVMHSNVVLERDKHSWFIFLFTGLHAVHILAGLAGLAYLWHRARQQVSGPRYQMTTRAYANALTIFWHYLGFLWIVLFALLLTWRR